MSAEKAEQFSIMVEEEGQPQLLPFTVERRYSSSRLIQATDLLTTCDQAGANRELHDHLYQQPNDLFSLKPNKQISTFFKDQYLPDDHGVPAERSQDAPVKWMSSKMRLMRKMMAEEHLGTINRPRRRMRHRHPCHPLLNRDINTVIRVCAACNTTKTPLWRSGPQGPKSLCNACGIRQMKARRAVMASAIARNIPERVELTVRRNENLQDVDRSIPYKKRYKFIKPGADHLKLQFDERSAPAMFHTAFPQDEKDAAILLMALSCG